MNGTTLYPSSMPVVQEEIIKTLTRHGELTIADLIKNMPQGTSINIRAAVLPLVTLRRVEFTPNRKFRVLQQVRGH